MQIDKRYKLEKAVRTGKEIKDDPAAYVYIRPDCTAMATNGRIMAIVPCAVGSGDMSGRITPDSLTYARKHTLGDKAAVLHLIDNASAIAEDTTSFPREIESKVTDKGEQLELLRIATPEEKRDCETMVTVIPEWNANAVVLRINPALLKTLADALGSPECVTMYLMPDEFNKVLSCIRVETKADDGPKAIGAIMPISND